MAHTLTSVQALSGDTPVYQLSVNQLLEILERKAPEKEVRKAEPTERRYVYGLAGLCKLLGCSHPTAQRIKDSGEIPYVQMGRKLLFDADAVLEALSKTRKKYHRHAR